MLKNVGETIWVNVVLSAMAFAPSQSWNPCNECLAVVHSCSEYI